MEDRGALRLNYLGVLEERFTLVTRERLLLNLAESQTNAARKRGDWGGSGRTHRTLLVGASSFRLVILD